MARNELRGMVWRQMGALAGLGLGERTEMSANRDEFVVRLDHQGAAALRDRPEADGFIRSDGTGLLFRDATKAFRDAVPPMLRHRATASAKGLEFRWSQLQPDDVRALFATVRSVAEQAVPDVADAADAQQLPA